MHINYDANREAQEEVSFDDFLKVDIRIGTVVEVLDFPEARKASYILKVDFGEAIGIRTTSAQICHHYTKESLLAKRVAGVVNFPVKKIASIKSEFLLLGFSDENQNVVLFNLDYAVPNGSRLH